MKIIVKIEEDSTSPGGPTLGTVARWIKVGLVKKYNSHQLCKKFKVEERGCD